MAGAAVKQFGALDRVGLGFGFMAVDAPTHIDGLFNGGNCLCAHIAMTIFTVQSGGDVGTMIEMNKIRHLVNRNPIDRFLCFNVTAQLL